MTPEMSKELDEAILAGNNALYHLTKAQERLDNARNWGIADILGGGMIISMIKRSKMENAREEMYAAKQALNDLVREIRDLDMYFEIDFDTDGLVEFADVFFDHLIFDWIAQSKIKKARMQVAEAIRNVEEVLDALGELREEY